jgi:hypothetical protein
MKNCGTKLNYPDIHKYTCKHPDHINFYQIDHLLKGKRHGSCVLYVRSWRGANIESDHIFDLFKKSVNRQKTKINIEALRSSEVADEV